jgi:hypothetical protein
VRTHAVSRVVPVGSALDGDDGVLVLEDRGDRAAAARAKDKVGVVGADRD